MHGLKQYAILVCHDSVNYVAALTLNGVIFNVLISEIIYFFCWENLILHWISYLLQWNSLART